MKSLYLGAVLTTGSPQVIIRIDGMCVLSGAGSGMKWDIPCPACGARGIVRQEWCTRCGGDGRAASSVTVSIAIPAGVSMLCHTPSYSNVALCDACGGAGGPSERLCTSSPELGIFPRPAL